MLVMKAFILIIVFNGDILSHNSHWFYLQFEDISEL